MKQVEPIPELDLILSIRPEFLSMILNGTKTAEIRKTCPRYPNIQNVWIYQTQTKTEPGAVVGFWEFDFYEIDCQCPDVLARRYDQNHIFHTFQTHANPHVESYITDYLLGYEKGYALPIKNITRIKPVPFQSLFPGMKPSPGFLYVEPVDLGKVEVICG